MVYPCRCPTAEWRLRDKRDNAPRQGVPQKEEGTQGLGSEGGQKEEEKKTRMPCYPSQPAWHLTACWGKGTHGRLPTHAITAAGRGEPLIVRLFFSPTSLPSPAVNCDTCMLSFRAILPSFWHTLARGQGVSEKARAWVRVVVRIFTRETKKTGWVSCCKCML